jgi:hypothetical protein
VRPRPALSTAKRLLVLVAGLALALAAAPAASAVLPSLSQLSTDPYTNSTSQHATEVEPDTFAAGNTIVSAFQSGRFSDGGSSNVGWAASTDAGSSWTHDFLPGITTNATTPGSYDRATDPSVAYDAKDNRWLIASLALSGTSVNGSAVLVSYASGTDLTSWSSPVTVATATGSADFDKTWIVCDNNALTPANTANPYYGHCYATWDDFGDGDRLKTSTSTDGGLTWGTAKNTGDNATGLGGQPLVQPDGTVIVPAADAFESSIISYKSTDGGSTWSNTTTIAAVKDHTEAGRLRSGPLPTAEIDGSGKVYVAWADCRFRTRCRSNDIVYSTSTDGTSWSSIARVPIDGTGSGVDHFLPGLAVDSTAASASAHLALAYYYYPQSKCGIANCQLDVGYTYSLDGGTSWATGTQVAGPMRVTSLANTNQGYMVGDYISTSLAGGTAHPVFASANPPTGTVFDEAMYSPTGGLALPSANFVVTSSGSHPVPNAASDHAAAPAPITHH